MSSWTFAFALSALACASSGADALAGAAGAVHGGNGGSPSIPSGGVAGQASDGALASGSGAAPSGGEAAAGGATAGGAAGSGAMAGGAGGNGLAGGGQTSAGAGSAGSAGASGNGSMLLMPLGDSITAGSSGTNAGYRGPLFNLLRKSALNVLFVGSSQAGAPTTNMDALPLDQRHHEGHPSYTINDINANLDGLNTATFKMYGGADRDPNGGHWLDGIGSGANARAAVYPDVITLMVGTNDASDPDRTAVRTQLHALLSKITTLRPNTRLLVAQITPSNRPNNASYNAAVTSEVTSFQAAGKHVAVVDMATNFPADGLSSDQTHPNDRGYAFMAQQWFDAIVK